MWSRTEECSNSADSNLLTKKSKRNLLKRPERPKNADLQEKSALKKKDLLLRKPRNTPSYRRSSRSRLKNLKFSVEV